MIDKRFLLDKSSIICCVHKRFVHRLGIACLLNQQHDQESAIHPNKGLETALVPSQPSPSTIHHPCWRRDWVMCLMVVEGMKGASVRLRHQLQRRSFTIRNTFIVIGLYLWRMAVITRQIMIGLFSFLGIPGLGCQWSSAKSSMMELYPEACGTRKEEI